MFIRVCPRAFAIFGSKLEPADGSRVHRTIWIFDFMAAGLYRALVMGFQKARKLQVVDISDEDQKMP